MFASSHFAGNPVQYGTMHRLVCVLLLFMLLAPVLRAGDAPPLPLVNAPSAILIDRVTGLVLWQHNPDLPMPIASTTKIMTALVILDHGSDKLDDIVRVSHTAASVGGSSTFAEGDTATLRTLLQGALICSSNEATIAAAEYLTPSHTAAEFVGWMNAKATELGLKHTHYANTHGLYDPRHYSSARDLATIARYALNNYPLIRQIVASGAVCDRAKVMVQVAPRGNVRLENHNKLLGQPVPGVADAVFDGVKTGWVIKSGYCLVSSATRRDWQLISVVLNSPEMWDDAKNLMHYGFTRYEWRTYAAPAQPVGEARVAWGGASCAVPVGVSAPLGAPLPKAGTVPDADDPLVFTPSMSALRAPVRQGQQVGTVALMRNGKVIASLPAIALRDVPVSRWVVMLKAFGCVLIALMASLLAGRIYGTRAKIARRRRRLLSAQRGEADSGGASFR